jgi:hypothetical protein
MPISRISPSVIGGPEYLSNRGFGGNSPRGGRGSHTLMYASCTHRHSSCLLEEPNHQQKNYGTNYRSTIWGPWPSSNSAYIAPGFKHDDGGSLVVA